MRTVARALAMTTTSLLLVGLVPGVAHAAGATRSAEAPTAGSVIAAMPSSISATFTGQTIAANSPATPLSFTVTAPGLAANFACSTPTVSAPTPDTISCTPSHPDVTSYAEGLYTVSYSFTSVPAGPSSGSFTFTLDATAPTLVSTVPANAGSMRPKTSGQATNYVTATSNEDLGASSTLVIKTSADAVVASTKSFPTTKTMRATPNALLPVANGYKAVITLVDLAGNVTGPVTQTFNVVATPTPTVQITPSPYTKASSPSPIVVSGTSDAAGDTVVVTLATTGSVTTQTSPVLAGTAGAYSATFTASTPDGDLTATATTTDVNGNASATATATSVKDTVAPSVLSSNPAAGASEKSATSGVPNGITFLADQVLHQTSSTIVITHDGNTVASTRSFPSSTSIKATPTDVLPEGTYSATVVLVDAVGNAANPVTQTFVIDDTKPSNLNYSPGPAVINIARASAYTVSGTGEPAATVNLSLTDSALTAVNGATTVAPNGTWSITSNVSGLLDGAVGLLVTQTDAALNTSDPVTSSTVKDTVAPRVSLQDFDDTSYNATQGTAVVTGKVDNGSNTTGEVGDAVQVVIHDAGAGVTSPVSGLTGTGGLFSVSVPISALADGVLTASITATDQVQNPSLTVTKTSSKDTVAPITPTVTIVNPVNAGNAGSVSVSGVTEALVPTVLVSVNDSDAATAAITGTAAALANGGYSVNGLNLSSLNDGTLTVTAVATDVAGNPSAAGSTTTRKDVLPPQATTVVKPAFVNLANVAAVPISGVVPGSGTDLGTVVLTITDTGAGQVDKTATVAPNGTWSVSADLSSLADGAISILAVAKDTAGNPGLATSPTPTMTKDTVVPGSPATTATPDPLNHSYALAQSPTPVPFTVGGTVAAPDSGVAGLTAAITVSDADAATSDLSFVADVVSDAFAHDFTYAQVSGLTDGQLTIRVIITDAAGNSGVSTVSHVTKDLTALAITSSAPAAGSFIQSASTVVVSFNEALATAISSSEITVKKGGVTLAGSNTPSNGNRTLTFTPASAPLSEGLYDVFVKATDVNDSTDVLEPGVTPTFSFTVDATAPVMPTLTSVANPVTAANKTAVPVSGNATEQFLTVSVTISGTSGTPVTATAVSGAGGAYTIPVNVSSLPDGVLTVGSASSTDRAGNVSPVSSATLTTTKDATLPVVAPLSATATDYAHPSTTISGSVSEPVGSTVAISATDGTHTVSGTAPVSAGSFSGTLNTVTFNAGQFTVTVTATDTVGNVGTASVVTTHDTATPPTAAPTGVSALANDRAATVSFTAVPNTAPGNGGASISSYTVVIKNTATSATSTFPAAGSPVRVTGLTNGVLYTFQVRANNRAGAGPLSSASNVVKPMGSSSVTIAALPTRVTAGTIIKLSGKLTRTDTSVAAAQVTIRARWDNGTVVTIARVTPTSTGAWSYSVKAAFNRYYSVAYPGDSKSTSSASAYRRVLAAAKVSAYAAQGSHTVNQVITGSVYPNKAGRTVTLYRVTSTGSLVKLATARLSSTSAYRFSVRLRAGYTTLRVAIGATPNNVAGYRQFRAYRT